MTMEIMIPKNILQGVILPNDYFPGNSRYPLLIYKKVFMDTVSQKTIFDLLGRNGWCNAWLDSIYNYHHYHSNTHEALVIISGYGKVQFGGENGVIYPIAAGDVIIIPAGVAHKRLTLSKDFSCIGAYPFDVKYDMKKGKEEEYLGALEKINEVGLPNQDPIFGEKGLLFKYWH